MSLRVAMLAPFASPSVRGNAITVERIASGVRARGVDLVLLDLSVTPRASAEAQIEAFAPSVIHAFHAYRVGPQALRLARRLEVPLVVTITGTDANHDLFDPERAPVVRRVLEGAAALVVFHPSVGERIAAALPDLRPRLIAVPQAVALARRDTFDLPGRWALPPDRVLFAFPAGIRPVKRSRLPLAPLGRLLSRLPAVRLLYAGPVLDPGEGDALLRALASRPWARHVGAVPHGQMASLLAQSDVVLNCSISEGGMANSVLEALAMGRAVLASDIEGNRSLIEDGVTGLLFRDEDDFEAAAGRLSRDPALRGRLGAAGRARVEALYPASKEIDGYLNVYRGLAPVASA